MSALPPFGTPEWLEAGTRQANDVSPVTPHVSRTTTWDFADRAAVRAAMFDASPGTFYPRYGHPGIIALEAEMSVLERAEASLAFASGMAAIAAVPHALLGPGEGYAYAAACYGGTHALGRDLPRFGFSSHRFDAFSLSDLDRVLDQDVRIVHVESPVNPTGRVVDLEAIVARVAGRAIVCCDGTLLPPPLQRPIEMGVDLVVHSATKFLGGHSDILAGIVSGKRELVARLEKWRRLSGGLLAPDDAWLLRRSLATVELRARAENENARKVAEWLANDARVERVHYPFDREFGGALVTFEPRGGEQAMTRTYDSLRRIRRAVSLGGVESLASIPIDTSHVAYGDEEFEKLGFGRHAIRLSVGLEPFEDLRDDLDQALHGF
ncbi:MAG: aminotransferase class V-fold PLP-dependent enzyme [Planctomycetes bacterium]|nr:aminotransferase class V-fold PLP-dependent enzyme [Planctomycetota bacterium]